MNIQKEILKYAQALLKEAEEEQQERMNEGKPVFLLSKIVDTLINRDDSKLRDISRTKAASIFSSGYDVNINMDDESGKAQNIDIDLEDLFSTEVSDGAEKEYENYTIKFDIGTIAKEAAINKHVFKDLLEIFTLFINNYFGGFLTSKQTSTDDLIGYGKNLRSHDTMKFKSAFIWKLIEDPSIQKLFRNENIDLNKDVVSQTKISFYDITLLKSAIMFVFDNIHELIEHLGINILTMAKNPGSQFYKFSQMMINFITVSGFEHFILNPAFEPSNRVAKAPDVSTFVSAIKVDNASRPVSIKDELFNYMAYVKYQVLKYAQTFVTKSEVGSDRVTTEEGVSDVIRKTLRLLKENQEQQNEKERIIGMINAVVSNISPDSDVKSSELTKDYKMSEEYFDKLVMLPEVQDQVKTFANILAKTPTTFAEKEPEVQNEKESEVKEETDIDEKTDDKKDMKEEKLSAKKKQTSMLV